MFLVIILIISISYPQRQKSKTDMVKTIAETWDMNEAKEEMGTRDSGIFNRLAEVSPPPPSLNVL